jgi:hypothetical protein
MLGLLLAPSAAFAADPEQCQAQNWLRTSGVGAGLTAYPTASSAPPVQCHITCGGQIVDCNCNVGSCSASGTTLVCDGHTTTCSEVLAYDACWTNCQNQFGDCFFGCNLMDQDCFEACLAQETACYAGCGNDPDLNTCG